MQFETFPGAAGPGQAAERRRKEDSVLDPMQSYIVRIYRKEGSEPGCRLLGIVEAVGGRGKMAFTDYDGLWEILSAGEGEYLTERSSRSGKRKGTGSRSGTEGALRSGKRKR